MDQKPSTVPVHGQNIGFQAPPAYDQYQNYPNQYQGPPLTYPPGQQPQVVHSKLWNNIIRYRWLICLLFVFSHHWKHFRTWPSFNYLPKLPPIDNYTNWIWTVDEDPLDGWIDVLAVLALLLPALPRGLLQRCEALVRILFVTLLKPSNNNLFYSCPHCGAYLGTYRGS